MSKLRPVILLSILLALAPASFLPSAGPTAAAQTGLPAATAPVPDQARVAAALKGAPVMFVENAGQIEGGARFQVRTGDGPGYINPATADTAIAAANLRVAIIDSPDPVGGGGILTYAITVTNYGPASAVNVILTDTVPLSTTFRSLTTPAGWTCDTPPVGGTGNVVCTTPSLASKTSQTFTMAVLVRARTPRGTFIHNQARVSSDTADSYLGDNLATATTRTGATTLVVSIADSPATVGGGGILTYTVDVSDYGPLRAVNVILTDTVPTGTTFQSLVAPRGWTCDIPPVGGTGNVVCTAPNLASVEGGLTMRVLVSAGTPAGGSIENAAAVSSDTDDTDFGRNWGYASTRVGPANLYATLSDTPDPVVGGGILTYAIAAANYGPLAAVNVILTDTVPAGTTFQSLTAPAGWTCDTPPVGGTGNMVCSALSLAYWASRTFTMTVLVGAGTPGGTYIHNQARVSSDTGDPYPLDNSAKATTMVAATAP